MLGALLCIAAALLFANGWYWTGLAAGLLFSVLDTVDGQLARCTLACSWLGKVLDRGIDLIHPPSWGWAWGAGLHAYGRPLEAETFWAVLAAIVGGSLAQRAIEAAFVARFGIHLAAWRPFDSRFRLVAAGRDTNMAILAGFLAAGRPDWGLIAVAGWTLTSLAVDTVRLGQALAARRGGKPVTSWLA
jgi:phosphatidylglycerophosphate synthase